MTVRMRVRMRVSTSEYESQNESENDKSENDKSENESQNESESESRATVGVAHFIAKRFPAERDFLNRGDTQYLWIQRVHFHTVIIYRVLTPSTIGVVQGGVQRQGS